MGRTEKTVPLPSPISLHNAEPSLLLVSTLGSKLPSLLPLFLCKPHSQEGGRSRSRAQAEFPAGPALCENEGGWAGGQRGPGVLSWAQGGDSNKDSYH